MNTSSKTQINESLQRWLDSLPRAVPLRASDLYDPQAKSLESGDASRTPPNDGNHLLDLFANSRLPTDSLITAMLWLRIGVIDKPHEIVQEGKTPIASYLHGIVHRMEGDFWNSKYWFKQSQENRLLQSLSNFMEQKLKDERLLSFAAGLQIMQGKVFVPVELVSACEKLSQQLQPNTVSIVTLEKICWIEWEAIWHMM